jgi:hypothetical protein
VAMMRTGGSRGRDSEDGRGDQENSQGLHGDSFQRGAEI